MICLHSFNAVGKGWTQSLTVIYFLFTFRNIFLLTYLPSYFLIYLFIAAAYGFVFDKEDYCFDYTQYFFTNSSILIPSGIGFDYCLRTTLVSYRICSPLQLYRRI